MNACGNCIAEPWSIFVTIKCVRNDLRDPNATKEKADRNVIEEKASLVEDVKCSYEVKPYLSEYKPDKLLFLTPVEVAC